jgi:dienelactone hydrolase
LLGIHGDLPPRQSYGRRRQDISGPGGAGTPLGEITAKILVAHGALDPHVPAEQVTAFIEEMNAAGADYQLIVYGGAMHGFTHDVGMQAPGVAHHAASDKRSFLAIKAFLSEIFGTQIASATAQPLNL